MEDQPELTEQIQKPKKPRSEKQIDAFNKARQIRTDKALLKKQKIKEIKDTINTTPLNELRPDELGIKPVAKKPLKHIVISHDNSSDDESEDEIIIKKKKPKKKKIVYESSSEEDDEEPAPSQSRVKQNKKMAQPTQPRQTNNPYPAILFF